MDGGKPLIFKGFLHQFPLATRAVAILSEKGAKKYSWDNWRKVSNGFERYTEALSRHLLYEANGEDIDEETDELHAIATAWNAMARLEILLATGGNHSDGSETTTEEEEGTTNPALYRTPPYKGRT